MQPPGAPQKFELPNIQYLVAVASGKGGVGKSTVAANLALALAKRGKRVGLMDADIYGPSIPTMLGVGDVDPQTTPFPIHKHGLEVMSMGFLLGPDKAAILRGPMVQRYLQSFLTQIDWGRLDYLLVDMPPGTGDAQLALAQTAPVAGTIIVTTPQDVSLNVARRGVQMFRQVQVPVLGVVENMSYLHRRRRQTLRDLPPRRRPQAGGGIGRAVPGRGPDRPAGGGVRRRRRAGGGEIPGFGGGAGVHGPGGQCGHAAAAGGGAAGIAGSAALTGRAPQRCNSLDECQACGVHGEAGVTCDARAAGRRRQVRRGSAPTGMSTGRAARSNGIAWLPPIGPDRANRR